MTKYNVVVAVTGASGAPYAQRLIKELVKQDELILTVMASDAGLFVYHLETGVSLKDDLPPGVRFYGENDFLAPFASGSTPLKAMVIAPCTMATLGAIAWGNGRNLIHRTADVCLKEKRTLVLVPRETPLHEGHLENMLRCARLGAVILPAMPGFYHKPSSIDDLVNFVVARILDHLKINHRLVGNWSSEQLVEV
ncbi:MAG: UbiX family flavin prenyltransferase [Thermodesulforhabdaceae bacterium]